MRYWVSDHMRVLMLMPDLRVKGPIAGHGAHLVDAMRRDGADVVVRRWGRHSDEEGLFAKLVGRIADISHVRTMLRHGGFDVLFVKTAHDRRALVRDLPLMVATRGYAGRRVLQFHGSLSNQLHMPQRRVMKAASRWLVRRSDAILVLSSEEAREWKAFEPSARIFVVSNCYAHKPSLEGAHSAALDDDSPLVILFVGRLIAAKGVFDLVEAFSRVQRKAACRLALAGDGEARETLERLIRSKGLEGSVSLLGHVKGLDLVRAYMDADVFALPSYNEGFPTVLAEAMDAGLPIVTTGIRGAVDHLADGRNALFVPPGRIDLLAASLHRVLVNEDLRHEMGAANRDKVRDFAPQVVARDYLRILEDVLTEPGRGAPR